MVVHVVSIKGCKAGEEDIYVQPAPNLTSLKAAFGRWMRGLAARYCAPIVLFRAAQPLEVTVRN